MSGVGPQIEAVMRDPAAYVERQIRQLLVRLGGDASTFDIGISVTGEGHVGGQIGVYVSGQLDLGALLTGIGPLDDQHTEGG